MARSKRKTKIFGNTSADSERLDKRRWNKSFRRVAKVLITKDKEAPINIRAVSNVAKGDKDGKNYWENATPKDMRK